MDITGRQLRRLKSLLPEAQQEEFKAIFASAFNKEDVTKECQAALGCSSSWGMITLRHKERTIATIDLRKNPGFINTHEDYIFEVHYSDGKIFRAYKLRD